MSSIYDSNASKVGIENFAPQFLLQIALELMSWRFTVESKVTLELFSFVRIQQWLRKGVKPPVSTLREGCHLANKASSELKPVYHVHTMWSTP